MGRRRPGGGVGGEGGGRLPHGTSEAARRGPTEGAPTAAGQRRADGRSPRGSRAEERGGDRHWEEGAARRARRRR